MNTPELNNTEPTAAHPSDRPASDTVCPDRVGISSTPSQQNLSASDIAAVYYPCFVLATFDIGPTKVYCLNTEDDAIAYGRRILRDFEAYQVVRTEDLVLFRQAGEAIPDDVILDARTEGYAVRLTDNVWLSASRAPNPLAWLYECLQSRLKANSLMVAYNFEDARTLFEDSGMDLRFHGDLLMYAITDTVKQNYSWENGFSLLNLLSKLGIPVDICDGDSQRFIHLAAIHNDALGAQYLIDEQVGIHFPDANDMTPLMYAACVDAGSVISLLLAAGAGMVYDTRAQVSAIHLAAQNAHADIIKLLCSYDVDPNTIDAQNATPLLYAAREGHLACIEVLLAAGANWTAEDCHGNTALSIALEHEHQSVVAALEAKLLTAQRTRPPEHESRASLGL